MDEYESPSSRSQGVLLGEDDDSSPPLRRSPRLLQAARRPSPSRRRVQAPDVGRRGGGRGAGRDAPRGGRGAGRGAAGRGGSGPRFSIAEMDLMLDAIQQVLPLGPEEWAEVADKHMLS